MLNLTRIVGYIVDSNGIGGFWTLAIIDRSKTDHKLSGEGCSFVYGLDGAGPKQRTTMTFFSACSSKTVLIS